MADFGPAGLASVSDILIKTNLKRKARNVLTGNGLVTFAGAHNGQLTKGETLHIPFFTGVSGLVDYDLTNHEWTDGAQPAFDSISVTITKDRDLSTWVDRRIAGSTPFDRLRPAIAGKLIKYADERELFVLNALLAETEQVNGDAITALSGTFSTKDAANTEASITEIAIQAKELFLGTPALLVPSREYTWYAKQVGEVVKDLGVYNGEMVMANGVALIEYNLLPVAADGKVESLLLDLDGDEVFVGLQSLQDAGIDSTGVKGSKDIFHGRMVYGGRAIGDNIYPVTFDREVS